MKKLMIGMKGWFMSGMGVNQHAQRAEVIHVWSDTCVNLRCEDGSQPTSVLIKQPGCGGYYFEPDHVDDIDALAHAKGLTAPRISMAELEANIVHTKIVKHISPSGQVLRWAVLTVKSGFAVTGRPSAAVSSENDDVEIGERVAIENAKAELWPLMGYELRARLAAAAQPVVTDDLVNRFLTWPVPASVCPDGVPGQPGRTGTNLLSAAEARQMLEHVLGKA